MIPRLIDSKSATDRGDDVSRVREHELFHGRTERAHPGQPRSRWGRGAGWIPRRPEPPRFRLEPPVPSGQPALRQPGAFGGPVRPPGSRRMRLLPECRSVHRVFLMESPHFVQEVSSELPPHRRQHLFAIRLALGLYGTHFLCLAVPERLVLDGPQVDLDVQGATLQGRSRQKGSHTSV